MSSAAMSPFRIASGVAAAGGAYATYLYQTNEGTRRAVIAYSTFLPIIARYRYVEWRDRDSKSEEYAALDAQYAADAVAAMGELQGMYCKYAQTAAGMATTLSDVWVQELRKLEDQVPPRSIEDVFQTIEEETGAHWSETFATFDPVPLGSASIGQVHRATLKSDPTQVVAVKVQYANARRLFKKDMRTIRAMCTLAAPEQLFMLDALEEQNGAELDYTLEAASLREVARNMKRHGLAPREVVVPHPIDGLSTKRLLVMELLPGPKLIDGLRAYGRAVAKREGTTLEALEANMKAKFESGDIAPKYNGSSARQIERYLAFMVARDAACNFAIRIWNWVVQFIGARVVSLLLPELELLSWERLQLPLMSTTLPPNGPRVIDTLMRVHGYQMLCDGVFNADPHGGNFLMLPDDRIGLIDFGATKRYSRNERLMACLTFAALAKNDEQMLLDLVLVTGYKSKYNDKEVVTKLMQFAYDSWGKDVTGGKNVIEFTDELKRRDPWQEVPDNFVMGQLMRYVWYTCIICLIKGCA